MAQLKLEVKLIGLAWVDYLLLSQPAVAKRAALTRVNVIGGQCAFSEKGVCG